MAGIDIGDGKIEISLNTYAEGGAVTARIDRIAWLLWWQSLDGTPSGWISAAQEKFKSETGLDLNPGQAARLLGGLKKGAADFFD